MFRVKSFRFEGYKVPTDEIEDWLNLPMNADAEKVEICPIIEANHRHAAPDGTLIIFAYSKH